MKSSRGDLFEQVDLVRRVAAEHEAGPLVDATDSRERLFAATALRSICFSLAALDIADRALEAKESGICRDLFNSDAGSTHTVRAARAELVSSQMLLISDLLIESAFGVGAVGDSADRTRILGDLLESLTRLQDMEASPSTPFGVK